jgi:glycosyltransferase involved in cell wall biosynthesis
MSPAIAQIDRASGDDVALADPRKAFGAMANVDDRPMGVSRQSLEARGGPIKIAILGSRGYPSTYGGYETLVRHIARAWASDGHEVTVYCRTRRAGDPARTWEVDGVRCIWTPGRDTKSASTLSFGLTSHVDAAARHFDAALVLNVANGFYLPLLVARGIPTVVNTDGVEWARGKWGPTARKVFHKGAELSARYADVLVSDSRAIADVWDEEFGVRPRYIPYGAEVQRELGHNRVTDLGFEPRTYALAVARLTPENNVELTLDAVDAMADRRPAIVVGSANYGSDIEERLQGLDEAGRIRWLGHVHDQELLMQLWAHCGVYVHGHSVGGTNPALLQALGAGAPTLALDTPFNREVIVHEDQFYPHDAASLACRMEEVLASDATQRAWASRGKLTIHSRFQWQCVCDAYECALRDAIEISAHHSSIRRLL